MGSPETMTDVPRALTIAGSDSGGGAGIQADLKTFLSLGVHGMSAIVSLTAQNTTGVSAVHDVPLDMIAEQISQVVTDIGVDSVKTGMLSNAPIVETVADAVDRFGLEKLIVDPVFVSKNKDTLLEPAAVGALRSLLIPKALLITPNLDEAEGLLGEPVSDLAGMREAVKRLMDLGPRAVLLKGGHLTGAAADIYFDGDRIVELPGVRIDSEHTHGTGCILSAAITAYVARGFGLLDAVVGAKEFVTGAIRKGLAIGRGYGPANPGWDSTLSG